MFCLRKISLSQYHEEFWEKTKTLRDAVVAPIHSTRVSLKVGISQDGRVKGHLFIFS